MDHISQSTPQPIQQSITQSVIQSIPPIQSTTQSSQSIPPIQSTTQSSQPPHNWTTDNTTTVRNWKLSLTKASFVYQYVLDHTQTKMNRALVIIMILGAISTALNSVTTTLLTTNSTVHQYLSLAMSATVLIITTIITILSSLIKIYKWDTISADYSSFVNNMDQIYSLIAAELLLSPDLRGDAITFIQNTNDKVIALMQKSPNVDLRDYKNALLDYDKFIKGENVNFKCSQKYVTDGDVNIN